MRDKPLILNTSWNQGNKKIDYRKFRERLLRDRVVRKEETPRGNGAHKEGKP